MLSGQRHLVPTQGRSGEEGSQKGTPDLGPEGGGGGLTEACWAGLGLGGEGVSRQRTPVRAGPCALMIRESWRPGQRGRGVGDVASEATGKGLQGWGPCSGVCTCSCRQPRG